jgi:uncharacterized protein
MQDQNQQAFTDWAIRNLRHYYVKVAPSQIHGVGLFAIRDIPKETVVLTFSYRDFPCVEIRKSVLKDKLPKEVYSQIIKNWAETEKTIFVPVNINQQLHYVNFLNHSKDPNVRYQDEKYISMRRILKGEEILIDFHEADYNPSGVRFKG